MIPISILAGGLGTRLHPITETIPKSLLEVAGEPFIAHQLRELSRQGIQNVVICVGFLGEKIEEYVKDKSRVLEIFILSKYFFKASICDSMLIPKAMVFLGIF